MHWATLLPLLGACSLTFAHSDSRKTKSDDPRQYKALITTPGEVEIGNCSFRPRGLGPPDFGPRTLMYSMHSPTLSDYTLVFQDLISAVKDGKYLGNYELVTYSPQMCANLCDRKGDCGGFNIFFESTPTLYLGPECRSAPSSTTIRCVL
jgi:hypothetical protein